MTDRSAWRPGKRIQKSRVFWGWQISPFPFFGVLFPLLALFMITPASTEHHSFVDLALASSATAQPKANREDAMRIVVSRDGSIFFRNIKVSADDLPSLIRSAVKSGSERRIYLSVDARARYSDIEPALDAIREAGVHEITLLAEERQAH